MSFQRLVFTLALAICCSLATAEDAKLRAKKVLYLGIDGCRFDAIETADTPHLDGLMKNGSTSNRCLILGERYRKNDTISGPGWSTIYTGVWADKHGVQNNTFKGSNYEDYPHFFRRVKEALPTARLVSFVTWAPIQKFIVSSADLNEVDEFGKDYTKSDTAAAARVGNVDETGHARGFHPSVPAYIAAVEEADKHVGEVLTAIKARPTYAEEEWLVVVTSDHGGQGFNHSTGHNVPEIFNSFLIVSGDAAQRGEFSEQVYLVNAVPTILKFLGVKIDPAWKLDGRAVGLK